MTNNHEPEHRQIDNEGNYNERIEGDYVQGRNNFLNNSFVVSLFGRPSSPEPLSSKRLSQIRQILLKQVDLEVDSRLRSSLHNRIYIALNVEQNPEQIELPWASEIKVGNLPKIKLEQTDIINVFAQEDIAGRLLILGQPGAGKTTMLLKLADELVKRAKNNQADPVPVLFTLSNWKKDNQNIKDWLVEQLKSKYGVRKDIGRQWVANQEIIPLLDGLDELAAERQEKCVIQINEFLNPKNWNSPLVICSRFEEYQRYTTLLQLNNSLELSPLSDEQITQYLQNTGVLQLDNSISHDTDLKELAKTPLLLSIIVLSAEEISIETWQQFNSSEKRLTYLFDAYIRRMLKRPYKDKDKQPQPENTQRWLSWLAQRLIEENTTEFLIEKMQPNWLNNQFRKNIYNLIFWGLIGSLINGLVWGLYGFIYEAENKLFLGLFNGLIVGLLTGMILGQFEQQLIQLRENKFVKKIILIPPIKLLSKTTINGLTLGLSSGLIYATYGLIVKLFLGLTNIFIDTFNFYTFSEIIFGLIVGLTYGLVGETIQTVETIKFSLKKFLIGWKEWIVFGLIFGLTSELFFVMISGANEILNINLKETLVQYLILNFNSNIHKIILLGVMLGLIISVVGGLISGISGIEIEKKTYANQGIWRSLNNCIILSLVISLLGTLIIFPCELARQILSTNQLIVNSIFSGILLGILIGITRSGTPAIKHFILRVVLWSNGYIPWNYAKFLDYSTQRLFLQRVGGGYRFIHDLFRQQFANVLTEINIKTINNQPQTVQEGKLRNILLIATILIVMGATSWLFHLQETNIDAYKNQGFSYDNKKDYDLAIAEYNKVIKLDPNSANAYYNRGLAYYHKKEYDQAIADYNKAIAINPNYTDAYIYRGNAYNEKKESDKAMADYNKAIAIDPNSTNAYIYRGLAYEQKKEYDQAIVDYNKAIAINPNYTDAYIYRGNAYNEKKESDKAMADYNKAIAIDPNSTNAYIYRGLAYEQKKEYDQAIVDYNKAIAIDPNSANAYIYPGLAYYEKKEYDQAIADYNKAITIDPNSANAYYNRGLAYKQKKEYDQAIVDYNKAIAIDPNSANAYDYDNRGLAYYHKKEYDQAIADYNKAIAIDPNYADAYYNRGLAYYHKKEYDQAIADYNKAIAIDPNYTDAYIYRGNAYENKGIKDKAIEDFKKVLQLNDDIELSQKIKQELQKLSKR